MFLMYDSVDVNQIPNGPHAVAAYIDGHYITIHDVWRRFPTGVRILTVSTGSGTVADCYDIERGDYKPEDAASLFEHASNHGVWRPCFYASRVAMPLVESSLRKVVKHRDEVRLWFADWTDHAHTLPGADAVQFTDHALNRNLDESLCLDTFFKPVQPPHTIEHRAPASAHVMYDPITRQWNIHGD